MTTPASSLEEFILQAKFHKPVELPQKGTVYTYLSSEIQFVFHRVWEADSRVLVWHYLGTTREFLTYLSDWKKEFYLYEYKDDVDNWI